MPDVRYRRLSFEEREQIAIWLLEGVSRAEMARRLGRCSSTINRELVRNRLQSGSYEANLARLPSGGYEANFAEWASLARRERLPQLDRNERLERFVVQRLIEGWSPELIAMWLTEFGGEWQKTGSESGLRGFGAEPIYSFIRRAQQKVVKNSISDDRSHSTTSIITEGIITRIHPKGFGFISRESFEKDLFFRKEEIRMLEFDDIQEGDSVKFDIIETPRGPLVASIFLGLEAIVRKVDKSRDELEENDHTQEVADEVGVLDPQHEEIALLTSERIRLHVNELQRSLVREVARDPRALDTIEWRDLERLIAEAFDGLGFGVELTAAGKDGGKDILLRFDYLGKKITYAIEIKHWTCGSRVGPRTVDEFVHLIVEQRWAGGLFLATGGYTKNCFECLDEIERVRVGLGSESKIVSLCRKYVRKKIGVWESSDILEKIVFDDVLFDTRKTHS